jgi:hypothetical protein
MIESRATTLLREAHRDGPTHAQRTEIWKGVEAGIASSAVAAGGVKAMSGVSKLLLGALAGAVTATVVALIVARSQPAEVALAPAVVVHTSTAPRAIPPIDQPVIELADTPPPATVARSMAPAKGVPATTEDDALAHEARLVAEARGALKRGDADQALSIVRAARSAPNPALEPEELALEARALRDLGRPAEADTVAAELSRRFPENALAH